MNSIALKSARSEHATEFLHPTGWGSGSFIGSGALGVDLNVRLCGVWHGLGTAPCAAALGDTASMKRVRFVGAVAAVGLAAATMAPARPAAVRACTAHDLRALSGMLQGATGMMAGAIRLRNVSSIRCTLGARPRVMIMTVSGKLLRTREHALRWGRPVSTAPPRATVELHLNWSNWCRSWSARTGGERRLLVRIRLTTGTRLWARMRTGRPRCDQPSAGSMLFVSHFLTPT
jgi:hypothetical protein